MESEGRKYNENESQIEIKKSEGGREDKKSRNKQK